MVNLQVIEKKNADVIGDVLTRLSCEVGLPTHFLLDQDNVIREVGIGIIDLQGRLSRQFGIYFNTCPVSGPVKIPNHPLDIYRRGYLNYMTDMATVEEIVATLPVMTKLNHVLPSENIIRELFR